MTDRTGFIGGSDAPGVLGLSRWTTPLSIWAAKTGQVVDKQEETLPQKLGKRLEPIIGELFTEHTGLKIRRVNDHQIHKDYPFLAAQIDFRVVGDDSIVECKSASGWKAKEWKGEDIPQEYIIQAMHQLAVTGKDKCYVAVLIGGNQDFKIKVVERDEKMIAEMVKREVAFWNTFVVPKVMPSTITKDDSDVLYSLFPLAEPESEIDLGDEGARMIESRNALYQDVIAIEGQLEKVENEIKALLKDKETGVAGKYKVTWKNQSQIRIDTKLLKQKMPDVYKDFGKESKFRKFDVREMKTNDNA